MGMRVILLLYLCAGAGRVQAEAEGLPSTADAIALASSIEHSMAAGAGAATARLGEPCRTRRAAAADQRWASPAQARAIWMHPRPISASARPSMVCGFAGVDLALDHARSLLGIVPGAICPSREPPS